MKKIQKIIRLTVLAGALTMFAGNAEAFLIPQFFKTYIEDFIRFRAVYMMKQSLETSIRNNELHANEVVGRGNQHEASKMEAKPKNDFKEKLAQKAGDFTKNIKWDQFANYPLESITSAAETVGKREMDAFVAAKKSDAEKALQKELDKQKAKLKKEKKEKKAKENDKAAAEKGYKAYEKSIFNWLQDNSAVEADSAGKTSE